MAFVRPVLGRGILRAFRTAITRSRLPVIAGHKLLYRCNLECKMCPFWRREDEQLLSLEQEIAMMESLRKAGVLFLGFEGGEPLLRKDITDILRESYSRFHTSMVTNGWLLRSKVSTVADYLNHLFVSIDGIDDVHDRLRGVAGSYKRAVDGIQAASELVPTTISSTITAENLDQAEGIISLAKDLSVSVNFQIAYDYTTAEKEAPSKMLLKNTIQKLLAAKQAGAPIMNTKEYFSSILDSWYNGLSWACKPWLTINIDPTGKIVMPCYVLNEYSGESIVWEANIPKMWKSFGWGEFESCNKCALACYLEPSLFSWTKPSMVKSRIIDSISSYVTGAVAR